MRLPHKKLEGRISILGDDRGVEITIEDHVSSEPIARVTMTPEMFVRCAMGRLACATCEVEVGELSRIGKKMEVSKFTFPVPDMEYGKRKETAAKLALTHCPEGWFPDLYFSSQDSFFRTLDGKEMARCTMRRWVDESCNS